MSRSADKEETRTRNLVARNQNWRGKSRDFQFKDVTPSLGSRSVDNNLYRNYIHRIHRSSTDRRASILARDLSLGPRGDGTGDCLCCCTVPRNDGDILGTATLCGLAVGLDALAECCDGGGTNNGEEGREPLLVGNPGDAALPPPPEPMSTEPAAYPVVPSFCFLLPNELNNPPVNAFTLPLLVEAFIPADDGPSCRSTSCGYGRPSGARAIGWERTARSVISVAEVLSMRMGN